MPSPHGGAHLRKALRSARSKSLVPVDTELLGYSLAIVLFLLMVVSIAKYFDPTG